MSLGPNQFSALDHNLWYWAKIGVSSFDKNIDDTMLKGFFRN